MNMDNILKTISPRDLSRIVSYLINWEVVAKIPYNNANELQLGIYTELSGYWVIRFPVVMYPEETAKQVLKHAGSFMHNNTLGACKLHFRYRKLFAK